MPEIETPCLQVKSTYQDCINQDIIEATSDLFDLTTHDIYFIQAERVIERYNSNLDKLLSIFEQSHFENDTKISKKFPHPIDTEEVKIITDILHRISTDPVERHLIEREHANSQALNAMFEKRNNA